MATRSFHIVSVYSPQEVEEVVQEDLDAGWSSGYSLRSKPPLFVKPSGQYDEFGRPLVQNQDEDDDEIQFIERRAPDHGKWYKELQRNSTSMSNPKLTPSSSPQNEISDTIIKNCKSPWFLSNIHQSLPTSGSSTSTSIPEMLSRSPPPLPSEARVLPPTWTHIGPSNKGYGLLERHGWKEGDALGISVSKLPKSSEKRRTSPATIGRRIKGEIDDEGCGVIDLTFESSEGSQTEEEISEDRRALLVPLPTILRSARSGLGSKRAVKKTITNTAEAVRVIEEARRRKRKPREMLTHGGAKSAKRKAHMERMERRQMLNDLKSTI